MTEKGSGTVFSVRRGEGSGWKGCPHGMFHRIDETSSGKKASDSAHHSRSVNCPKMPEALLETRQGKWRSLKQLNGGWRSSVKIVEVWVHARHVC